MSTLHPDLPNTVFPAGIDDIVSLLNITPEDAPLVRQFQLYIQAANFSQATDVFNQIVNANRKIVSSTYWNTLRDAILALERFYKTDIEPYISTKQEEWQNIINRFSFLHLFDHSMQYLKNNYVIYTVDGIQVVFISINTPPIGTIPTNTTYWRQLTIKGAAGPSGDTASFLYEWKISADYSINDIVTHNNKWWNSIQPNKGQEPILSSSYWSPVLEITSLVYPIQPNEPIGQDVGLLWFQIINQL